MVVLDMPEIYDKTESCISFIVECFTRKISNGDGPGPLFVGVNGAQGSGKTTLVSSTRRGGYSPKVRVI